MLVSPQILVWFRDQKSLKIPKLQWHCVRLDELRAVVLAAVVETCDFAACFIYLSFVPERTLQRQFGSLAMLARPMDCHWPVDTIQIPVLHVWILHILLEVLLQRLR